MKFVTNVKHDGKDYPKGSECPKDLIAVMQKQGLVSKDGGTKPKSEEKASLVGADKSVRVEPATKIEGEPAIGSEE